MATNFAITAYALIREMHSRFASHNTRAMIEDESLCYQQHLRMATKHALLIEILIEQRIAKIQKEAQQ